MISPQAPIHPKTSAPSSPRRQLRDRGVPDEKIHAVPEHDPLQSEFTELADLPKHLLMEIQHFFQTYKDLEGKRVEALGWEDRSAAYQAINDSIARYEKRYP